MANKYMKVFNFISNQGNTNYKHNKVLLQILEYDYNFENK